MNFFSELFRNPSNVKGAAWTHYKGTWEQQFRFNRDTKEVREYRYGVCVREGLSKDDVEGLLIKGGAR